jgi:hypothetical protein
VFAALPGFRDPSRGFPDSWFDFSREVPRFARSAWVSGVEWGRRSVVVQVQTRLPDLEVIAGGTAAVTVGGQPAALTMERPSAGRFGTLLRAEIPLERLPRDRSRRKVLPVRFSCVVLGRRYTVALTGTPPSGLNRILFRRGLRFFTVAVGYDREQHLVVRIKPIGPRHVGRRLLARLSRR